MKTFRLRKQLTFETFGNESQLENARSPVWIPEQQKLFLRFLKLQCIDVDLGGVFKLPIPISNFTKVQKAKKSFCVLESNNKRAFSSCLSIQQFQTVCFVSQKLFIASLITGRSQVLRFSKMKIHPKNKYFSKTLDFR